MLSSTFLDMQKMPSDSTKVVFYTYHFLFLGSLLDVLLILKSVCKSNNSVWMGGGGELSQFQSLLLSICQNCKLMFFLHMLYRDIF